jgi:signal transduction histidine kinase
MFARAQTFIEEGERAALFQRAKIYVLVRLSVDVGLLIFLLLQAFITRAAPLVVLVAALDILNLLVYLVTVRRWPAAATYLHLIVSALLIIAFDFAWGGIYLVPWFLTIPLSIVGGLIVVRAGFNGLVTLSIVAIFGVYLGLIIVGRITLPLAIPPDLLIAMSAALAVVLLIINIVTESLVVYLYQTEESQLQTRAQLLYTLQELEQLRNRLHQVENQTRRMERLSTVGQIAEQLSRSLRAPLEEIERILGSPDQIQNNPAVIRELHEQVKAALRMTDGLKEYARLTELHITTVNLDDVLAAELAKIRIPENVKLIIHQPPVFPPIQADREKIQLVIHHLLHNALQAVEPEGGEIVIQLEPRPDGVAFTIQDSGPGIPPEELQLIFEPLYTTQHQRFGLGLAIVQRVVEMHGGYIEVDSEVGRGSTFTVFLPRVAKSAVTATTMDATL